MRFRCAFLNCHDLFEVGQHAKRSLKTDAALREKIRGLGSALTKAFRPELPELVGLAEIGSPQMAADLMAAVAPGRYSIVFQQPPKAETRGSPELGLALAYDASRLVVDLPHAGEITPGEAHRFHWLAARVVLRKSGPIPKAFLAIVNHWPSNSKSGATRGMWPRALVGKMIGEFLLRRDSDADRGVLMMGDFNCEPWDPALGGELMTGEDRIVAVREHSRSRNPGVDLPYFYNLMWRVCGEAMPIESQLLLGAMQPTRPPGTYVPRNATGQGLAWRTWDQILVNRWMMSDGPISVIEESLVVSPTIADSSDHCAVGVCFDYSDV